MTAEFEDEVEVEVEEGVEVEVEFEWTQPPRLIRARAVSIAMMR